MKRVLAVRGGGSFLALLLAVASSFLIASLAPGAPARGRKAGAGSRARASSKTERKGEPAAVDSLSRSSVVSLCAAAERHTGRPYVWGATGLKSFDCSGYVWRSMIENGILIKRTTARKLYFSLRTVPDSARYREDTIVFFDNLKHCGIVHDDSTFYHAQLSRGTNLSRFDPFWRRKITGFRRLKGG